MNESAHSEVSIKYEIQKKTSKDLQCQPESNSTFNFLA